MPKNEFSTYIVYLDLPTDVATEIDNIRRAVNSPGIKRWVAHITLKQDADYPDQPEEIERRVADFAGMMKPVRLTLEGLKLRREDDGISWNIYVGIREKELLHELTKNISRILTPLTLAETAEEKQNLLWEQSDDYYPHISVIGGQDIETGKKLLKHLSSEFDVSGQIICRSITLAKWNTDKWTRVKTFTLSQ